MRCRTLPCVRIEAILNDGPLTTATNDPSDLEPLTPRHLLLLRTKPTMPPGLFYSKAKVCTLGKDGGKSKLIADLFWTRWVREYLPLMQERRSSRHCGTRPLQGMRGYSWCSPGVHMRETGCKQHRTNNLHVEEQPTFFSCLR